MRRASRHARLRSRPLSLDQSHRIREFRRFIGMTPAEFERTPKPLLTAGLKLRAERKAEAG